MKILLSLLLLLCLVPFVHGKSKYTKDETYYIQEICKAVESYHEAIEKGWDSEKSKARGKLRSFMPPLKRTQSDFSKIEYEYNGKSLGEWVELYKNSLKVQRVAHDEQLRVTAEKKKTEQIRLAEEKRIAEEAQLVEEQRIKAAKIKAEQKRIAEVARKTKLAEEIRLAEKAKLARLAEEKAIAEEKRRVEEVKLAELEAQRKLAEALRLEKEAEIARLKAEAEMLEQGRLKNESEISLTSEKTRYEEAKAASLEKERALAEILKKTESYNVENVGDRGRDEVKFVGLRMDIDPAARGIWRAFATIKSNQDINYGEYDLLRAHATKVTFSDGREIAVSKIGKVKQNSNNGNYIALDSGSSIFICDTKNAGVKFIQLFDSQGNEILKALISIHQ